MGIRCTGWERRERFDRSQEAVLSLEERIGMMMKCSAVGQISFPIIWKTVIWYSVPRRERSARRGFRRRIDTIMRHCAESHRKLVLPCGNFGELSTRSLCHCCVVISQRCHRIASFFRLALTQISGTDFHRYFRNAVLAGEILYIIHFIMRSYPVRMRVGTRKSKIILR